MGKYIDADRLRAEIEKIYKSEIQPWLSGVSATSAIYDYVLPLIDSLQQEQSDFPITDKQIKEFLATHPKVEVPEKYKTPDFVFKKQEYESYPIISKDTTSVKPAEWSEEDERILKGIIGKIDHDQTYGVSKAEMLSFLKSLRPVSKESLQPHWKPSEEEIEAVRYFVNKHQSEAWAATGQWKQFTALRGLLGNLEKLM